MQQLELNLKHVQKIHCPDFQGLILEQCRLVGKILDIYCGGDEVDEECEIVNVPQCVGGLFRRER